MNQVCTYTQITLHIFNELFCIKPCNTRPHSLLRMPYLGDNMKRDMDLVKCILIEIEKVEDENYFCINVSGYSEDFVNYHLELLNEAGLKTLKF